MLQPNEVDFIIYHHPCSDGMGSALVLWKYIMDTKPNHLRNITFYPTNHGLHPPDVTGRNVLICDFSYRRDILINMIEKANKLLVIDHHKSSEKDLAQVDDKNKIFSMNNSGAVLTWKYFYPGIQVPLLLQYIEDRDIWLKKLPNTDAFTAWFFNVPLDIESYSRYLDDDALMNMIETKGKPYEELNIFNINKSSKHACPTFCKIRDRYYFIAYLNTTTLKSDIGHDIFNKLPYIDFSAVYDINDWNNTTSFSLRSMNHCADVSEIAFNMGGGGHRNASGVRVMSVTNRLLATHYDSFGEIYNSLETIIFKDLVIDDKIYKVACINTNIKQNELAAYLVQPKYKNKLNNFVQEATFIDAVRKKINSDELEKYLESEDNNFKVHIGIAWSYDGYKNETICCIQLDSSIENTPDGISIKNYFGSVGKGILIFSGILSLFN